MITISIPARRKYLKAIKGFNAKNNKKFKIRCKETYHRFGGRRFVIYVFGTLEDVCGYLYDLKTVIDINYNFYYKPDEIDSAVFVTNL